MKRPPDWFLGGVIGLVLMLVVIFLPSLCDNSVCRITDNIAEYYNFAGALIAGWLGLIYLLAPAFTFGAIFGQVYHFAKRSKATLIIFLAVLAALIIWQVNRTTAGYRPTKALDQECASTTAQSTGERQQDYCYLNLANVKHSPDVCSKITNKHIKDDCYVRTQTQGYWMCENRSPVTEKMACIKHVAIMKAECEKLSGADADECYSRNTEATLIYAQDNQCNTLELGRISTCKQYQSGKITKKELCAKIISEKLRQDCLKL